MSVCRGNVLMWSMCVLKERCECVCVCVYVEVERDMGVGEKLRVSKRS